MIAFRGVAKRFGERVAVDGLDLEVARGEIFGLIGPDGAGKTTSIRMLLGLLRPDRGAIEPRPGGAKGGVGYVPQRFSLYGDLTVMENIRLMGRLYGAGRREIAARAEEILGLTGLIPFVNRRAKLLSGGMKQKLALSAALMHRPELLVLDEPTTGVDPVSRRDFWRHLYRLNHDGVTIVAATPYMDEAELCTRVAFMRRGRVVVEGTPAALKAGYPYQILEAAVARRDLRGILTDCPLVDVNAFGERHHLVVEDIARAQPRIEAALAKQPEPFRLARVEPTLEDVYVALAKGTEDSNP